jgi:hypothetical protein
MFKTSALAAVLGLTLSSAASATVIFADDFDSNTGVLNGTPSGWDVSNGTVDIIPRSSDGAFNFFPGNGLYIDMDGSTGNAGRIDTVATFNAVAGYSYSISFDYGRNGSGTETLTFGFGGSSFTLVIDGTNSLSNAFTTFTLTFTALTTGTSTLFFEAAGSDNQGPVIDNVSLAAVPVPAGGLLLLGALGGLAALRRRKTA